ncbi:MAG: DnaJ C-terminal domain-containing protein [Candidatus Zixiibacteriota bacterium]
MNKDFYKVLGVSEDASKEQIRKVYRQLAKKYHPDRNKGDKTAEAKFKELQEAYAVLSDDKQREQYDLMRKYGDFAGAGQSGYGPGGMGGFDFSELFRGGGEGSGSRVFRFGRPGNRQRAEDLGDLFESFFGGRGEADDGEAVEDILADRNTGRTQRGADVATTIAIPFMDSATGVTKSLRIAGGNKTIRVKIPAGIEDGGRIRLKGQGRPGLYGGRNGDLIITVRVMPDQYFRREGNDIHTTVEVSFIEAIKGCKREVRTLTRTVSLTIPPGTQPGTRLRLKGMGLDVGGQTGDQYVEVKVTLPTTLTEKQRRLIEEWEE